MRSPLPVYRDFTLPHWRLQVLQLPLVVVEATVLTVLATGTCHRHRYYQLHTRLLSRHCKLVLASVQYARIPESAPRATSPAPIPYFLGYQQPASPSFDSPTPATRLFYRGTAVSHSMCVPGNCLILGPAGPEALFSGIARTQHAYQGQCAAGQTGCQLLDEPTTLSSSLLLLWTLLLLHSCRR